MDQKNLADLYELDPIPWSRAAKALESERPPNGTTFLATTRTDGRPHLAGVGAMWDEGKVTSSAGLGPARARISRRTRTAPWRCRCPVSTWSSRAWPNA